MESKMEFGGGYVSSKVDFQDLKAADIDTTREEFCLCRNCNSF